MPKAQDFNYVHYNTKDGLAGSTVYSICQDKDGFIWFGTDEPEKFQLTMVTFTPKQSLVVEQNGYYFDQTDITINQYLAWKKMSDRPPGDFKIP